MNKKLIAVTRIDRVTKQGERADKQTGKPAVRPTVQTIKSGTVFVAQNEDEEKELLKSGAARRPRDGETVQVPIENADPDTAEERKEAAKKAKSENATPKQKLEAEAIALGLDVESKDTIDSLTKKITDAKKSGDGDDLV